MDMTEDEMKQDVENIMPTRLESLLELALRTSTANVDPYKDDLKYVKGELFVHMCSCLVLFGCRQMSNFMFLVAWL